jgi:hypothetical protein
MMSEMDPSLPEWVVRDVSVLPPVSDPKSDIARRPKGRSLSFNRGCFLVFGTEPDTRRGIGLASPPLFLAATGD